MALSAPNLSSPSLPACRLLQYPTAQSDTALKAPMMTSSLGAHLSSAQQPTQRELSAPHSSEPPPINGQGAGRGLLPPVAGSVHFSQQHLLLEGSQSDQPMHLNVSSSNGSNMNKASGSSHMAPGSSAHRYNTSQILHNANGSSNIPNMAAPQDSAGSCCYNNNFFMFSGAAGHANGSRHTVSYSMQQQYQQPWHPAVTPHMNLPREGTDSIPRWVDSAASSLNAKGLSQSSPFPMGTEPPATPSLTVRSAPPVTASPGATPSATGLVGGPSSPSYLPIKRKPDGLVQTEEPPVKRQTLPAGGGPPPLSQSSSNSNDSYFKHLV